MWNLQWRFYQHTGPWTRRFCSPRSRGRFSISTADIAQVFMGNVMQASQEQSPARQASIFAGLPLSVDVITVNKHVCASGMKVVVLAAQQIQLGQTSAAAGGMENMDRVPLYIPPASQKPPFGEVKLHDGLIKDGLWDIYNDIHMGGCAENAAQKLHISRAQQESYATSSCERAQKAWSVGLFKQEVVPVTVESKTGKTVVNEDAGFQRLDVAKLTSLKPAFPHKGQGSIIVATSSPLCDGASALVLCDRTPVKKYGREKPESADTQTPPLARSTSHWQQRRPFLSL